MDIDSDNPLAMEIRQEAAAAYLAACRRMVDSLAALERFDREPLPSDASHLLRRSELLKVAAERVYFVVVQREAMKLSGHETFFEDYGVPAEVRACMGPRRST